MPAGLTQEWKIARAKAGGDFWFDWRDGKAQRLVARLLAPQLKASYAARKPVEINDLGMNLFFDREAQGWKVRVGDLAANFGEQRWGEVELLLRRDQQNNEPHWKLQADRVDLTPLVPAISAGAAAGRGGGVGGGPEAEGHPAQPERRFLAAAGGARAGQLRDQPGKGRYLGVP